MSKLINELSCKMINNEEWYRFDNKMREYIEWNEEYNI